MNILQSVCTNLFFPDSRRRADAFARMADFLRGYGVTGVECYCDGHERAGDMLKARGMDGVYIAVIPLKEQLKHLCDIDGAARQAAVALAERCMDSAAAGGFSSMMINSGKRVPGREEAGLEALARSVEELFEYRDKRGYALSIEMEPCDSAIDAAQLVGPWQRTLALCQEMARRGCPLRLTMDSAHTAEEGQDFFEAVTAVKPFCNHIHFANCRLDDPADPLYGDKHLGFEFKRSVWTFAALADLTNRLQALYGEEPLRIGLECLCRRDDPYAWFEETWQALPEAFKSGGKTQP